MFLWGKGYGSSVADVASSSSSSSSSTSSTYEGDDLADLYSPSYWVELHERMLLARHPRFYDAAEVVKIVHLITQLLLYGEGLQDERMFEFFGQKDLLLTFCQMAREPRPLVACQAIQSLSLLLFNTKQDDMLHYLLSRNLINDFLFFDMDVDGEEIRDPYANLLRTIAMRITPGTAPLFLDHRKVSPSLPPSLPPSTLQGSSCSIDYLFS
ncbi:hypothetical protein VYU27_008478 [Nannochloropsis oceanica]